MRTKHKQGYKDKLGLRKELAEDGDDGKRGAAAEALFKLNDHAWCCWSTHGEGRSYGSYANSTGPTRPHLPAPIP